MRRAGALIVVLLAAALGGCASLTKSECRTGDWTAIGHADGERGLPASELDKHVDACKDHGVTPDAARYRAGHAQGLAAFCTPRGGYVAGRSGEGETAACPATAKDFREAHRRGRDVHVVLRDVQDLRRSLEDLQMAAMAGDYAPEDRTQMRFRADEIERRLRLREWELERLDRQYAREFGAPELTWQELRH
jgi:hypothetical protein